MAIGTESLKGRFIKRDGQGVCTSAPVKMNQGRSGRKHFNHRLKDALLLMGSIFLIALAFVAWQVCYYLVFFASAVFLSSPNVNRHRSRRVINFGFTISPRELFFSLQASDEHVPSQHWLTRVKATTFDTNYPEESTCATPSSSVVDQHQYVLCIEKHALSSFPACDQHLTGVTCLIAQGGISFRGVGRSVRGPTATRVPLAFGRSKNLGEGPASDTKPAPAGPLVTPKQALEGASRWSSALLRVMPPFSSWMPPEAVAKAMDSLPPADAQQSAVQYSFPDALPKVRIGSHAGRTADVTSMFCRQALELLCERFCGSLHLQ